LSRGRTQRVFKDLKDRVVQSLAHLTQTVRVVTAGQILTSIERHIDDAEDVDKARIALFSQSSPRIEREDIVEKSPNGLEPTRVCRKMRKGVRKNLISEARTMDERRPGTEEINV